MRRSIVISTALASLCLLLAACGATASSTTGSTRVRSGATATTAAPGTTTPTTSAPVAAATGSAALPQAVCPTTYGVQPTTTPSLPSTVSESIATSLVSQIAVYTDAQGQMQILAPTGWACSASIGADGSSELAAFPQGQTNPTTSGATSGALTFSVQNAPSWATFNNATGELSGTPTAAGSFSITATDANGTTAGSACAITIN